MYELNSPASDDKNARSLYRAAARLYAPVCTERAMNTGIQCLDLNGGIKRCNVYYVAGAPEIGQMEFATNMVLHFLTENRNVFLALMNHTPEYVLRSAMCIAADVSPLFKDPMYTDGEDARIGEAFDFLKTADIKINASCTDSIEKLFEECVGSDPQPDLVVIDSGKLLYSVTDRKNETERIKERLNAIARECRCAVIVLDTASPAACRAIKKHRKPKAVFNKIRLGGKPFNKTDNVLIIHRDSYYRVPDKKEKSEMWILYHSEDDNMYLRCNYNIKTGRISD